MQLRNLFYLLLALPLVFAACENGSEGTDKKPDTPEVKDPVLTLTSDATMEFTAEGGAGEITYTLQNAVEGTTLTATCEAEWVKDVTAGETVTFAVAANDGDAREAKVVVAYGEQKFEVAVKQAKKEQGEEPGDEPKEPVAVTAQSLIGEYYGSDADYNPDSDLYYVILSDKVIDFEAEELVDGAAYYNLTLYAPKYEGEWKETMTLPVGEYTLDMEETYAAGRICGVESFFMTYDSAATEEPEPLMYEAAKLDVTETTVTLTATLGGVEHVVTFTGDQVIYNYTEPETPVVPSKPTEFAPVKVTASHSNMDAGNFMLNLYFNDSKFHEFDMYDETAPNDNYLSPGTYTTEDGTIGTEWSRYNDGAKKMNIESAELTLTLNQDDWTFTIVGEFSSVEGHAHTINWTGAIEGFVDPNAPEKMEVTKAEAVKRNNTTWEIFLWDIVDAQTQTTDFTRIVVSLAEDNILHVTDGTYNVTDGNILLCTPENNSESWYHVNSSTGGEITDCELTVAIDKENETAKLSGYFVATGKTVEFEWNGAVVGFRYKEMSADGITDWEYVYIYSQYKEFVKYDTSSLWLVSTNDDKFELQVRNSDNPIEKGIAAGTYPVAVWNDRLGVTYGKINGAYVESGELIVEVNDTEYTFTFAFTDEDGNEWKGSYTGPVEFTSYVHPWMDYE